MHTQYTHKTNTRTFSHAHTRTHTHTRTPHTCRVASQAKNYIAGLDPVGFHVVLTACNENARTHTYADICAWSIDVRAVL